MTLVETAAIRSMVAAVRSIRLQREKFPEAIQILRQQKSHSAGFEQYPVLRPLSRLRETRPEATETAEEEKARCGKRNSDASVGWHYVHRIVWIVAVESQPDGSTVGSKAPPGSVFPPGNEESGPQPREVSSSD